MDDFTRAYIECALWSSTDDDGRPLDDGEHYLSAQAHTKMETDCASFQRENAELLAELAPALPHDNAEQEAGHDFWLTRNGHGTGFWDRGLGDLGKRLSVASEAYGEADLYLGDDGLIHHS